MRRSIVAFSKDYWEDPTSNHHILQAAANHTRVLWLNSISTRKPTLSNSRDLSKITRKLRQFAQGPVEVRPNLWVASPLALPLPGVASAEAFNRHLLRATIRLWAKQLSLGAFDLWTFLPTTAPYVGTLGEVQSLYYCVDEWSMFTNLDTERILRQERELLGKVDATFAINDALAARKRQFCANTWVLPHGVDRELFSQALAPQPDNIPDDIKSLKGPIALFYGTLQDWVDYELLDRVASQLPWLHVLLIGQTLAEVPAALRAHQNVHFLGQKPHAELVDYCRVADVGLIPYRAIERMRYVNPIKLREYLCAGLPVVSTELGEAQKYAPHVRIAAADTFAAAIVQQIADDYGLPPAEIPSSYSQLHREEAFWSRRRARAQVVAGDSWNGKLAQLFAHMDGL